MLGMTKILIGAGALAVTGGLVAATLMVGGGDGEAAVTTTIATTTSTSSTTTTPVTVPPTTYPPVDPNCTISGKLVEGDVSADVACLETRLRQADMFFSPPDDRFDADTTVAVRAFQEYHGLVIDGIVGPQSAGKLGAWQGGAVAAPDPTTCAPVGHSAVVDRFNQRGWLCDTGAVTLTFPITSAWSQPDPGTYSVYEKNLEAASSLSGPVSTMTHFVAFTYGKNTGARIAFHSVPTYSDGQYIQPLESVGSLDQQGDSAGCIRVLPDDAQRIWDWLEVGDAVNVVS